jgi:hypothetical protein
LTRLKEPKDHCSYTLNPVTAVTHWRTLPAPHSDARGNLSADNTIGIVFGVLTVILGVLSVAFSWAMWLLKRRNNRRSRQATAAGVADDEMELRRIARDHHGNYVTL